MADRRVLVDTTLFIEHLRARDKTATQLYRLATVAEVEPCSNVAAEIFYGARQPKAESQAWAVLRPFPIHPFTVEMAARESAIVRELKKINRVPDLRDVMIAATALEMELPIATLNRAHFDRIPGLNMKVLPRVKN